MFKRTARKLYRMIRGAGLRALNALGLNVARTTDFYSPLPVLSDLEKHRERWDRPSEMIGVRYDLETMKALLARLVHDHAEEHARQPSYEQIQQMGYGPGFTIVDAQVLYYMIRDLKPRRYLEIGSGFSTYVSWLAIEENRRQGSPCDMTYVDPFPTGRLDNLEGLSSVASRVEDVELERFEQLEAGDVLFIDTTHVLKVDGDVAYLYLEVIPRLSPGVVIQAHDIAFPYNTPHPAEQYVFASKWPFYRTEAMVLQAFLSYNPNYEIVLSAPMLRHFDEDFLKRTLPNYRPLEVADYDTHFGSLWFRRVA